MKTPLYDIHKKLGVKWIDFAGWEMPLSYKGIVEEHLAVRRSAGLFDVSHMGRIEVRGPEAEAFLDYLSTNAITDKAVGTVTYTVLCDEHGGCVDDMLIYRLDQHHFFVVANASNKTKDMDHLLHYAKDFDVEILPRFAEEGILALQGPKALEIVGELFPEIKTLKPMRVANVNFQDESILIATTGYTGEKGIEIFAKNALMPAIWTALMEEGEEHGLKPVGLGARDTLRLEMGYALYGHELSDEIAPTESVSHWTVKLDKEDFLGKDRLEQLAATRAPRKQIGILLEEKGVPREGCLVIVNGKTVGVVTSGSYSPSLNQGICIGMVEVPVERDQEVAVEVRGRKIKGKVVSLPFVKQSTHKG